MTGVRISRRRCLTILAGLGALPLASAMPLGASRLEWRGLALGADARLVFADDDRERTQAALAAVLAEIERLERIFSLYRPDSELCRLNAYGHLSAPSQDMAILLGMCRRLHASTDGAFDPSVQPLWRALAEHFAVMPNDPPPALLVDDALRLVDFGRVAAGADVIRIDPGMALTLNGVAQGYITDRVAEILRGAGFARVLVQLGETRALPGKVWRISVPGLADLIALEDGAMATSAGAATPLSADGTWTHLLHPKRGRQPVVYRGVSVIASSATLADALSTALAVSTPEEVEGILGRFPGVHAIAVTAAGDVRRLGRG